METEMDKYFQSKKIIQDLRDQRESVRGKDTPWRVRFTYLGGSLHYQYFCSLEDAKASQDYLCRYNIFGDIEILKPIRRQIQVRGPRGSWSKFKEENKTND